MILRILALLVVIFGAGYAHAAGADAETRMAAVAAASPLIQAALRDDRLSAEHLRDPVVRRQTLAALFDPDDCIRYRIGMTGARQMEVVRGLRAHGWLAASMTDEAARRIIFPPVRDDGTSCPHLPIADLLAPGGDGVSHHSWPGGLAMHVAFNIGNARAQIRLYAEKSRASGIDEDKVVAAALWHDWAKALTLRWRADGTLAPEAAIAGTGAHHILSLAEVMRRGFPPSQVVIQACAHGVGLTQLRDWLGAAALIAGVDAGRYPVVLSPECLVHHLSDQNWVFADQAVARADQTLAAAAPHYGFTDPHGTRYRLCYRNVALADIGADRLFVAPAEERRRLLDALFGHAGACR